MNQSGGNGSSLPLFEQPAFQVTATPAHTSARPKARRSRSRRAYHALKVSQDTLQLPPYKPLGFLNQTNLIKKAQAGDIEAKKTIWLTHSRLAYSVINRYGVAGVDPFDAIQQTLLGFSRAIEKFDPQRLNEFSTYAYQWLRQSLLRNRSETNFFLRIPAHLYGPYIGFRKKVAFASTPNQWFDARATMLEQDPTLYHTLLRIHLINTWLPFNHAIEQPCPKDQPLQQLVHSELVQTIELAVEKLSPNHALIIRQRYGLSGQPEKTLEEIGSILHVTRERVRQLQVKAEARLEFLLRNYMRQRQANETLRHADFELTRNAVSGRVGHKFSFDQVFIGQQYAQHKLAKMWNFWGWNLLDHGIVTPEPDSKIILFITKQTQQPHAHSQVHLEGNILYMEWEANHAMNAPIRDAAANGDQIHLFYRELNLSDFTYYGNIQLQGATTMQNAPTRFIFNIHHQKDNLESAPLTPDAITS